MVTDTPNAEPEQTRLEVTQADREAAARQADSVGSAFGPVIRAGELDQHEAVQSWARHRLAAQRPDADALRLADEYAAKRDWNGAYYALRVALSALTPSDVVSERVGGEA